MHFSHEHKLLDIWTDLSSSPLLSPDVGREGKEHGGGGEEWRAAARLHVSSAPAYVTPSWPQLERGGSGGGGVIMMLSSLFITTPHEKTNSTSDVGLDFRRKTCCLDVLMREFSLQSLSPLPPSVVRHISD